MSSFKWPSAGGSGSGVSTYTSFSAFPATGGNGDLAIALDTRALYEYSTNANNWVIIGSVAVANLSGTNTGDVTLTAIGSTPNANAASLSGQALTLQPASTSFPGVVTTGTQSFAGTKTFSGHTILGDPGTEGSGILVNGLTFNSSLKVSDLDGTNYAQTILHRHSTTLEPLIVGARSNTDDATHADVTAGMNLLTLYGTGWLTASYKMFGSMSVAASSLGSLSATSAPGKIILNTTPDGAIIPTAHLTLDSDKSSVFAGAVTSTQYKSATANISTVGILALANNEDVSWRNAANGANLGLRVNASNILLADTPISATGAVTATNGQLVSTIATGTAPLSVSSTTPVTNLVAAGNATLALDNLSGVAINADLVSAQAGTFTVKSQDKTGAVSQAVIVQSGTTTTSGATGAVTLKSGTPGGSSGSGAVSLSTGNVGAGSGTSGAITAQTGTTVNGASGSMTLNTGNSSGAGSGSLTLQTGTAEANSAVGNITIYAQQTGVSQTGALIDIKTGSRDVAALSIHTTDINGSGYLNIYSGNGTTAGSGRVTINTGTGTSGSSGQLLFYTGQNTTSGTSGKISLYTGTNSGTGSSGLIEMYTGVGAVNSGAASLKTGDASGGNSGSITLQTGTATSTRGSIALNALAVNLTTTNGLDMGSKKITSLLDPTTAQDAATKAYVDNREPVFNGLEDPTAFAVSYSAANKQFTITYTGTAAYTVGGVRYTKTGSDVTTAHAATTGIWYCYYAAGGALTVSSTPWNLLTTAPIASAYYTTSNNGGSADAILYNERHPGVTGMDNATHEYIHDVIGMQIQSGCQISGYTLNTSGATAVSYGIAAGVVHDEDIENTITAQTDGGTYRIFFKTGTTASPVWNWVDVANSGISDNGTDIYYNQLTGGNWQRTAITANNTWVNYWVVLTNAVTAPQVAVIMGGASYGSLALAQAATFDVDVTSSGLLLPEGLVRYQLTYRHGAFGAPGNAQLASVLTVSRSIVSVSGGTTTSAASQIVTDTTSFTGNLSSADTDVQKALDTLNVMTQPRQVSNVGLAVSLASNTLVVALKQKDGATDPTAASPVIIGMPDSASDTSGKYTDVKVTAAMSITLGTGDSIGCTTAVSTLLNVWFINDSTNELGLEQTDVVTGIGTGTFTPMANGYRGSSTALTGGNDTDGKLVWSTSAHSSKPMRIIGQIRATWTTGTGWTAVSMVSVFPQPILRKYYYADSSNTTTFVVPNNVGTLTIWGHGGGGGGGAGGAGDGYGGMGGGGAASTSALQTVVPGSSHTITIGAGGAAGTGTSGSGGTGGTTSFGSVRSFLGAPGGIGGYSFSYANSVLYTNGYGVGGGGHAGTWDATSGTTAGQRSANASGGAAGGATQADGSGGGAGDGAGGAGGASTAAGSAGTDGGGGGGGGQSANGGAGGAGKIWVEWLQ